MRRRLLPYKGEIGIRGLSSDESTCTCSRCQIEPAIKAHHNKNGGLCVVSGQTTALCAGGRANLLLFFANKAINNRYIAGLCLEDALSVGLSLSALSRSRAVGARRSDPFFRRTCTTRTVAHANTQGVRTVRRICGSGSVQMVPLSHWWWRPCQPRGASWLLWQRPSYILRVRLARSVFTWPWMAPN